MDAYLLLYTSCYFSRRKTHTVSYLPYKVAVHMPNTKIKTNGRGEEEREKHQENVIKWQKNNNTPPSNRALSDEDFTVVSHRLIRGHFWVA